MTPDYAGSINRTPTESVVGATLPPFLFLDFCEACASLLLSCKRSSRAKLCIVGATFMTPDYAGSINRTPTESVVGTTLPQFLFVDFCEACALPLQEMDVVAERSSAL